LQAQALRRTVEAGAEVASFEKEVWQMRFRASGLFLLLTAASAIAQAPSKVLVATAKEVMTGLASPGTLICVSGTPASDPQGPPCSPGTEKIFIWNRNSLFEFQDVAGSAAGLVKGRASVVVHCDLDSNYYGYCWGTFDWIVPEAGGKWAGTWGGMHDFLTNTISYSATGFGTGGKLQGLQLKYEAAYTGPGPVQGRGLASRESRATRLAAA
jgi:hypothetical protein